MTFPVAVLPLLLRQPSSVLNGHDSAVLEQLVTAVGIDGVLLVNEGTDVVDGRRMSAACSPG